MIEGMWPADAPSTGRVLILADASSRLELSLIEEWVEKHRPAGVASNTIRLAPSRRRKPGQRTEPSLAEKAEEDWYLLPVRVVWSPASRLGMRQVSWWDVLKLGDPRDPDALRQRVIHRRWPDRLEIVAGPGADTRDLRALHDGQGSLTDFITRRAWRALERAERALRGDRYKVPRFLHEEITSSPSFRTESIRLGAMRNLGEPVAIARGRYYLREIAAKHSPFLIDLFANIINWVIRQGYGSMIYDRKQVAEISSLGREWPLVFLPAHRSNLDRLSLQFLKWENDLPPNHTAGGINMNFFPVGLLVRRTGVFFIRRSFKDNELYKFVLRHYLDYLVENRFPLEWYLEGGRSRSGKLLPPRFGLLAYVVGSWQRGKSDDVMLIPVSIVYDQIQDLSSYAGEARGDEKEKESFGWALRLIRSLRRRYGNIHIRFGEPLSVAKAMAGAQAEEGSTELAKLGLEVMYRVGEVTPITPASVLAIVMLSSASAARSLADVVEEVGELNRLIDQLALPVTERVDGVDEIGGVLELLAEHGNVSKFDGTEPIYHLGPGQELRASYYRNMAAHHFLPRAVLEMALHSMNGPIKEERLWELVGDYRDLLKFEFIFPDKEHFHDLIVTDLERLDPAWRDAETASLAALLRPATASWVVAPFLEAYLVVADELATYAEPVDDEKSFLEACMRRGGEYRLRGIVQPDVVSRVLFRQAMDLARNRALLEQSAGREGFAAEVRQALSGTGNNPPQSPRGDQEQH